MVGDDGLVCIQVGSEAHDLRLLACEYHKSVSFIPAVASNVV